MNSRFVIMCQAVSLLILAGCGNTGAVKETVLGQDDICPHAAECRDRAGDTVCVHHFPG